MLWSNHHDKIFQNHTRSLGSNLSHIRYRNLRDGHAIFLETSQMKRVCITNENATKGFEARFQLTIAHISPKNTGSFL